MSLTPQSRSKEAIEESLNEGYVNGLLTLIPTGAALALAMRNPAFVKRTNWQARTGLFLMPGMFAFALTSEQRLEHRMKEIAEESKHSSSTVKWAESQLGKKKETMDDYETERQLTELYRQSVEHSGVKIVEGEQLGVHHRMANYVLANPIKTLAGMAVPSVAWILYGNTGKEHLTFSVKLLHTRVFGQFATLSLLLSVMGFKEFMDQNGKFITEAEAEAKVEEMKDVRRQLMARLDYEREEEDAYKSEIAAAHEQDVLEHNTHTKKPKKKKNHKKDLVQSATDTIQE